MPNITAFDGVRSKLFLINKELLIVPGFKKLTIVNINKYEFVRKIETPDSGWIFGIYLINKKNIINRIWKKGNKVMKNRRK